MKVLKLRLLVSRLTKIKLRGQLEKRITESIDKEGRGVAWPMPIALVFDPSARVII